MVEGNNNCMALRRNKTDADEASLSKQNYDEIGAFAHKSLLSK